MTDKQIIEKFSEYIRSTVASYNPAFAGRICPFALRAAQENEIMYVILDTFYPSYLTIKIQEWLPHSDKKVLIFIQHPESKYIHDSTFLEWVAGYLNMLFCDQVECFASYPESSFRYKGVLTRRDPYGNIQVNRVADLVIAREKLKGTFYYENSGTSDR